MMHTRSRIVDFKKTHVVTLGLILAITLAACGSQESTVTPTAPATSTSSPQPSNTPAPTNTPEPTSTATPLPTDTPTPKPTRTPTPDVAATVEVEVMAKIAPELEKLGYSVEDGYLAWYSTGPQDIRVFDYGTIMILPIADDQILGDFILYTDVSWESTYGFSLCGIIYRAESGITDGEHYIFETLRLSGLPAWAISFMDGNQFIATVSGGIQTNRAIDLDQGSSNSYMLVVDKDKMTAYANGTRLRTQYDKHREEGALAFAAAQQSGETTCTFSNGWVWVMN